ncbi:hypothetical protein Htur_0479 [Haloterrigena turkmenica DSM 5511]|uniref:Uncharacterized protein n=1 Tax=Haloterrigena turkmenica (strain ATCC 51198 / DSM 5511 / JCM 9101 / NCIMB 13204 / VKM B-1734 / 4k) TaxID=543526 RepID=D2RVL3_HALTV|nr:hypothetical protein [Haloterrigena turkmenica]ADB59377.1 hypothetical protein Htur_0479 [Haloterrigena turkmenica DSM 5511]
MRRSLVIALALFVLALLFVGGPSLLFSPSTESVSPNETEVSPKMTELEDSDSRFWRYLSPEERFKQRSPINVIVRGDVDDIERVLTEASDGDWTEINETEAEAGPETYTLTGDGNRSDDLEDNETAGNEPTVNESTINESTVDAPPANDTDNDSAAANESSGPVPNLEWGDADGGTRYAYLDPGPNESGYWTTETHQLEDGDYYGQRYHIRLYESPNEDDQWVIMQTHSEHFDWFTLRHRVHGSQDAQTKVENDFMKHPRVDVEEDVHRMYLNNRNSSDADGWATVVDLTGMILLPGAVGLVARRRSRVLRADTGSQIDSERISDRAPSAIDDHLTDVDRRRIAAAYARIEIGHLLLVGTIVGLYFAVRFGGLALEHRAGFLTPHQIAGLLYPVLAVGIPTATYLVAGMLTRRLDAALVAAGSLAAAIWLDYGYLGVDSLPVDVVLQRMLVVVALGLIAGGAAKRATRESRFNDMLVAGVALWVLVLSGTLLGYF